VLAADAGEGASTVAGNLAAAAARLGARVLLLDGDLRRDRRAPEGGESHAGLQDVLTGTAALSDGICAAGLPGLDLLAPTMPVESPAGLLAGVNTETVIANARGLYDLVVIDAPSPLSVPDAFALLEHVDGVLVVARLGRARRERTLALRDALAASRATVVGIVANGARGPDTVPFGFQPLPAEPATPGQTLANGRPRTAVGLASAEPRA
jgi:non-specific protein-tyrosine kinase